MSYVLLDGEVIADTQDVSRLGVVRVDGEFRVGMQMVDGVMFNRGHFADLAAAWEAADRVSRELGLSTVEDD